MNPALRRYLRNVLEVIALLVFLAAFGWVFVKTLDYTMPFVLGLILALLLHPLTSFLEKRGATRTVSILTAMVTVIGLLIGSTTFLVAQIAQEANVLSGNIPAYFAVWGEWFQDQMDKGKLFYGSLPLNVKEKIQTTSSNMLVQLQHFATDFLQSIITGISGLPEKVVMIVMALIAAYFFLADREKLWKRIQAFSPPGWDKKLDLVVHDVNRSFVGLIRAQIILVIVTMILSIIGLLIMHVHYAILLGILLGVTGLVPIVGSGIMSVPWAVYAFVTGDIPLGIQLLILQGFISLVRHIIEPKILANSVGLDTLSTLIAMYIGMKAMGVLGLFLGPIVVIAIKSLIKARMFIDFIPVQSHSNSKIVTGNNTNDKHES
ncbi:sporulation integral membrane protein YtvI [Fodinisporobacter ferrooxydans]|uniref:Sporulation integral membrane protein YtvI n=1 Tax=Fodinisporobacter ferrooxydans TaxID=2901836 RepID=A0ABY4CNU8_9BACL|nr:sporulation integral membrane protein YtvI [Alicyclobacillaceae bacterium MYW30-H2]